MFTFLPPTLAQAGQEIKKIGTSQKDALYRSIKMDSTKTELHIIRPVVRNLYEHAEPLRSF